MIQQLKGKKKFNPPLRVEYCKCKTPDQPDEFNEYCRTCNRLINFKYRSKVKKGCFDHNNMPDNWLCDYDYIPYEQ